MVQDVTVHDIFTDIAIVGRPDVDLVVVLDENGVLERVPHIAVLVLEAFAVRRHEAFAARPEDALALA
jgi:hypothetical protein